MIDEKNNEMLVAKEYLATDSEIDACTEGLLDAIHNGATLKDVQGVSNETMQDVYCLAYDFYHHGKLDDAESLFRFLCIYDFYNPEYPMGLGAVFQLKKNYSKAIDFYALAYSLSKNDYRPMFYAGQCNLMLRHEVQAKKCFEIVVTNCDDKTLNKKAEAYLSALDDLAKDNAESAESQKTNKDS